MSQPEVSKGIFEEDFFASLYDSVHPWSIADDFYLARALECGDPVLDLGCGTGMLACAIAANGYEVTGVDPGEAMLRIARSRPGAERVLWICSDGQGLRVPQRFRFIYMTGHAFQQLLSDDDALVLLRAASAHLHPEGRLVLETRNPAAKAWLSWVPELSQRTIDSPQHGRISLFYDAQPDARGVVTIREHYQLLDKGIERVGHNRIRFIGQDHLARLLESADLAPCAWLGDWDASPFNAASREIIAVTRLKR